MTFFLHDEHDNIRIYPGRICNTIGQLSYDTFNLTLIIHNRLLNTVTILQTKLQNFSNSLNKKRYRSTYF